MYGRKSRGGRKAEDLAMELMYGILRTQNLSVVANENFQR